VPKSVIQPDFNATNVFTTVYGNLNTNDTVSVGSTYGTPIAQSSNPSSCLPSINSDGTYSFVCGVPGEYNFLVPVCSAGQTINCPLGLLTITVINTSLNNNPPIANTDIATTIGTSPVTLNTMANDKCANKACILSALSVTIVDQPNNGTASVNPTTGAITYTANSGFIGIDTLEYQVCDNSSPIPLCSTAFQFITVEPIGSPNSVVASDDFNKIKKGEVANGSVLFNDIDPEGNTLTVTPQTTTIPGIGTLVLNSNGVYTFTPNLSFLGTVDFPYTVCDNGTPSACTDATLHILVAPKPNLTSPDINATFTNLSLSGNVTTNDMIQSGTIYGTPVPDVSNPAGGIITMNPNGDYTFIAPNPGVYIYQVPVCPPFVTLDCPLEQLTITVTNPSPQTSNPNPPTANVDLGTTIGQAPVVLITLSNDACNNLPNCGLSSSSVTITSSPSHGLATVDPITGNITYTANLGFYGLDTLLYSVCDTSVTPNKCATSFQVITVIEPGGTNTVALNDDYKIIYGVQPVSGNVLLNDSDPEGNTLTVTSQNITTPEGILILNSDGTYTFTPGSGFSGSVDFPYQACDNGTPQVCALATLYITVSPTGPLPAVLSKLVIINKNCSNELFWSSYSEENTDYFEVYRMNDQENNFKLIGKIDAAGNSDVKLDYSFKDNGLASGVYIYKLSLVDLDKNFKNSESISITNSCQLFENPYLYPNPTTDNTTLLIPSLGNLDEYLISLSDMSGRTIFKINLTLDNEIGKVTMPTSKLSVGVYNVSIKSSNGVFTTRLIKK